MSAATQDPIRLAPAAARRSGEGGRRVYLALVSAVVVAAVAGIALSASSGTRGLRSIPPEQRAAVLSRTVEELREFCGAGHAAALADHCHELAAFAARFDECRGECEALVRPLLTPLPTR